MPSVVAVSLVKDEADVIERTVTWMLGQVDRVIVYDNGSTDGTREILEGLPIELHDDLDPAHYQGRKITAMAKKAGGDYVLSFDADEIWYSTDPGTIRDVFHDARNLCYSAFLYDHVPTDHYGGDHPFDKLAYRKVAPNDLTKVVGRIRPQVQFGEGSHCISYGNDRFPASVEGRLEVRHFPYRSPSQFVSKVRNGYNGRMLTDLGDDVSTHLRQFGKILNDEGEDALKEFYWTNFYRECSDPELVLDPCPA